MKARFNKDYPQIPVVIINIPIWARQEQEEFIRSRIKLHKSYKDIPDDDIPPCTPEERWASPDTYAVKRPNSKRALRVFDKQTDALEFKKTHVDCHILEIEDRKGGDRKCQDYCSVSKWCNYYKETYLQQEVANDRQK